MSPQFKPLQRLHDMLSSDLQSVNQLIITKMHSEIALIPQLANYLIASGGKRLRPLLTLAWAEMLGGNTKRQIALAVAVEFIHSATLLHDDVVDESLQRRHQKPANLVFGNQASVLVGDFLFARAFEIMVGDGSLDVLGLLSHAAMVISEGEVMQLAAQQDIELTVEKYQNIIIAKTASLFAAACETGAVVSDQPAEDKTRWRDIAKDYGIALGLAFQISDDVLDYHAQSAVLGKNIGDDFREGKVTLPVILAYQAGDSPEQDFWRKTISAAQRSEKDFHRALEYMTKHDSITRALEIARSHAQKARAVLAPLPPHPLKEILGDLADYCVDRVS